MAEHDENTAIMLPYAATSRVFSIVEHAVSVLHRAIAHRLEILFFNVFSGCIILAICACIRVKTVFFTKFQSDLTNKMVWENENSCDLSLTL